MKKIIIFVLIFTSLLNTASFADYDIKANEELINNTSYFLKTSIPSPTVSSVGGEWLIIGLKSSGIIYEEEYFEIYYQNLCNTLKEKNGILHNRKYTEYSRVVIALTLMDKDPSDVCGYNLLMPLADFEKTMVQGINGPIWALIAFDSGNYDIPYNPDAKVTATREMYINEILKRQNEDGGWALIGKSSDADVTAMTLQALSNYRFMPEVETAIKKALSHLSKAQLENGGFSSQGEENTESAVQVLTALCSLSVSYEDERFIKNGNTILDFLMNYCVDKYAFKHFKEDNELNVMATEQCLYALSALNNFYKNKPFIYRVKGEKPTVKIYPYKLNSKNLSVYLNNK